MSGLSDLSGIAVRAYTPGVRPTQSAAVNPVVSEENKPKQSPIADRRLAPAFSIELSLAAQKALGQTGGQQRPAVAAAPSQTADASTSYTQFSEGVGRREVPLASQQRDVVLGSRLNIQI